MLTLPIKRKWFDMIRNYDKEHEYRDICPYYIKRFSNLFEVSEQYLIDMIKLSKKSNETIILNCSKKQLCLRNGYSSKSPSIIVDTHLLIGKGMKEWGAEDKTIYFVLKILEIKMITI